VLNDSFRKRPEQAVADAERAIAVNRNYAGGYEALANACIYPVRSEEGIRATEEAIRLDPANKDYYGYLLGPFYNEMGALPGSDSRSQKNHSGVSEYANCSHSINFCLCRAWPRPGGTSGSS
jgi:tetratricopeptide (TPR) repeat protein